MKKKKILFAAYSMGLGGIETALLTLLNELDKNKYEITLVLEKVEGIFLEELDKSIKIVEYRPSNNKNVILRKFLNLLKKIKFNIKYKNKYDLAIAYATYSKPASFVARTASNNNALWVHNNYKDYYNGDKEKVKEFFESVEYKKFKKLIFVARSAVDDFIEMFPEEKEKSVYCNNLIDYNKIINLSEEKIEDENEKQTFTFLNIGRHDEHQKKLTRLLEAAKKLKEEDYNFIIEFVGDGQDREKYEELSKEYNLNNNVIFRGTKKNPYPYMKKADCIILTSEYEGYPVVFLESLVLQKPIITTNVSDAIKDIKDKYGIVVDKDVNQIKEAMKEMIENGFEIKNEFNAKEHNKKILDFLEELING